MITEAKNKAIKKPKKKADAPEPGNEKQCPKCERTNFNRICRCSKCGRVSCDRCDASQGTCNCEKVKNETKTV